MNFYVQHSEQFYVLLLYRVVNDTTGCRTKHSPRSIAFVVITYAFAARKAFILSGASSFLTDIEIDSRSIREGETTDGERDGGCVNERQRIAREARTRSQRGSLPLLSRTARTSPGRHGATHRAGIADASSPCYRVSH